MGRVILLVLLLALGAGTASGQAVIQESNEREVPFGFELGGGVALPFSPETLTDHYGTGFNMSGAFIAGIWDTASLFLDIQYTQLPIDSAPEGVADEGEAASWSGLVGLRFIAPGGGGGARPYTLLGIGPSLVGLENVDADRVAPLNREAEVYIFGAVGLGLLLDTPGPVSFFAEGRFQHSFSGDETLQYITPRAGLAVGL